MVIGRIAKRHIKSVIILILGLVIMTGMPVYSMAAVDAGGMTITSVTADGRNIFLKNDYAEVPGGCRRLVIHCDAQTGENMKYRYRLEGFDESFLDTTLQDMKSIQYTNLDGGVYRFILSMVDPATDEEADRRILTISVVRGWHEYTLFWFFVGMGFTLVAFLIGRYWGFSKAAVAEKKARDNQEFIDQTISAFSKLIDAKDRYTQGHSRRVAEYTKKLARRLGFSDEEVRKYHNIALLHDIGKVAIPDNILNKPMGLSDDEYEIMKSHSSRGREILEEIKMDPDLALGAGYHHERFDGRGYPQGLTGQEIPKVAQLIAVADTFDAMYSTRPYRKQLPLSVVLEELKDIAGTQLNEEYVKAFLELAEDGELFE